MKDANKATTSEEHRSFYARCLRPWAARVGDSLGHPLLSEKERAAGLCIETDLSTLAIGEGREKAEFLRSLSLAGILSRNECRNLLGFPDVPGADELLLPLNTGRADQLGANQNDGTR
jgi:phage portal protein BeeE